MQQKYKVDEKVLCFHGPLLYEAKCTKVKKEGNSFSYLIHYQGWNKNWDEWVSDSRMLKQNQDNLEKQRKLLSSHMAQTKGSKKSRKDTRSKSTKGGSDSNSNSRASTPVGDAKEVKVVAPAVGSGGHTRGNKRAFVEDDKSTSSREEEVKDVNTGNKKKRRKIETPVFLDDASSLNIDIPTELKYILCRDWDNIVNKKRLFNIPAKVTVTNIIDQYISHLNTTPALLDSPVKQSLAVEVMRGFGDYFNVSLGSQLLYSFERYQYKQDCENAGAVQPCDLYGSQHLLRLMLKVGDYLSSSKFVESDVKSIEEQLEDFLVYLNTNRSMFFMKKSYYNATQEYINKNAKLLSTSSLVHIK